ncbi:ROK family protein [Actinopolyspora halophila]|uniref:ROK family protein n=1 Tax=Actinopolyspora halophila TaxID=1850 RepID=UPI00037FB487|nr:ROK family protein [Actinopolyspora halophila]
MTNDQHSVDGHADLVVAVDVGGTGMAAEVLDRERTTHASATAATPRGDGAATTRAVVALIEKALSGLPSSARPAVRGIGLAIPGLVDTARGLALYSANVGWHNTPVRDQVQAALGLPVVLQHDVTAAGEAESRFGAGRGVSDLLVVVIGTGIAAVIIGGNRVVHGGAGQAGELGHVVVRPDGPLCGCGQRGCLEALASASGIARSYTTSTGRAVAGAADVWARLGRDAAADRVWQDAISALADGVLAACTLLAPDLVVFGGGLAEAGQDLLAPVHQRITERARVASVPSFARTELGRRAGLIGAAANARDHWNSAGTSTSTT